MLPISFTLGEVLEYMGNTRVARLLRKALNVPCVFVALLLLLVLVAVGFSGRVASAI